MPKYIEAGAVLQSASDFLDGVLFVERGSGSGKLKALVECALNHAIKTVPAEDVEPVIRCKNCGKRDMKDELYWCKPCGYRCHDGEWYCPAGVRRDEDASM